MSNVKWLPSDIHYLMSNAGTMKDKDIAVELSKGGREFTLKAIRQKRQKLGAIKENGRGVCKLKRIN